MNRTARTHRSGTRARALALLSLLVILLSLVQPAMTAGQDAPGVGTAAAETSVPTEYVAPGLAAPTVPDSESMTATDVPPVQTGVVTFLVMDQNREQLSDGYQLCLYGLECVNIVDGHATIPGVAVGDSQYRIVRTDSGNPLFIDTVHVGEVDTQAWNEIVLPLLLTADVPADTEVPTIDASTATASPTDEATGTSSPTDAITPTETATEATTPTVSATETSTATAAITPTLPITPSPTATATNTVPPTATATPGNGSGSVTGTNGAGLNCRATPSTSGTVITVLREGTVVPFTGLAKNGWQPVICASKAGFISTTYVVRANPTPVPSITPTVTKTITATPVGTGTVTPTKTATATPSATSGKITGTNGTGLNCRKTPSTSGVIITVIREGVTVPLRGPAQNGWQPVTCAGQAGYVSTSYLTVGSSTPSSTKIPTSTPSGTATATPVPGSGSGVVSGTGGGGVNCRKSPSADSAVITIVAEGTRVPFRGTATNGWQPVTCAGQAGYIYMLYLSGVASPGQGEFWIDVDLSSQYLVAYRGNTPVLGSYVSTGRPGFDTPTGNFRINQKLLSQTMTGVINGEYYYVPNVPYVMYFTDYGHALHGAYWHNNFGHVMSHGCVNEPLDVAAWMYSQAVIGTRVVVHW